MLENPIMTGFIIFVAWFFALWGLSSFLTEACGMVSKYAFPASIAAVTLPTALAVLIVYGQTEALWILGGMCFMELCLYLSGGMS